MAAALNHIRSNYGSEIRVDELARICGLSIYQLNRRLRSIFGITVSQLITKTRIDIASEMLQNKATPIAEIAQQELRLAGLRISGVHRNIVSGQSRWATVRNRTKQIVEFLISSKQ